MRKFVGKRVLLALLLAIAILLSLSAKPTFAAPHIANDTWGPWSCQNLATKGIPGGTMYSQGCASWDDNINSFLWASGGSTSSHGGPKAYAITTYATGYDRCHSTDPWIERNSTNATSYNTNSNGAGKGVGYFTDCSVYPNPDHMYEVWSEHYWQATSNSGLIVQEGASDY